MNRSEQEHTRIVRAWLDEGSTQLSPRVHDAVLREFPRITQDGPFSSGRGRFYRYAAVIVAAAAVAIVVLAGTRLVPGVGPGGPGPDASQPASPVPSATLRPIDYSYRDVGFIGLPPPGATPSSPNTGELVETYWISGSLPFDGAAYLYADGRLIWFEYPGDQSTGYLEQRLTPEGVELVQALATRWRPHGTEVRSLDPRHLPDLLPVGAWADITARPYVPSGFAACLSVSDPWHFFEDRAVDDLSEKMAMLPPAAADLLRYRAAVPSDDYGEPSFHCLGLTTEDARRLDAALRDAGLEQDEWRNRYLLEYHVDLDGDSPETWRLNVWFEPILPDGTIGCTSCG